MASSCKAPDNANILLYLRHKIQEIKESRHTLATTPATTPDTTPATMPDNSVAADGNQERSAHLELGKQFFFAGGQVATMKNNYLKYNLDGMQRTHIADKAPGTIRLCSYNVHFWTNVWENHCTINEIFQELALIKADICVLQEAIFGGGEVRINDFVKVDLSNITELIVACNYRPHFVFCNSVPSWFKSLYGNMMLIGDKFTCNKPLCPKLNETIHTFEKSVKTVTVSGSHTGTPETRCYILVELPIEVNGKSILFYGTHLDVGSEDLRTAQLLEIITHAAKKGCCAIIAGDFNTFDKELYDADDQRRTNSFGKLNGGAIQLLKDKKYFNMNKRAVGEDMTTWNGTTVDYFFTNCDKLECTYTQVFSVMSDHTPVVVDIRLSSDHNP